MVAMTGGILYLSIERTSETMTQDHVCWNWDATALIPRSSLLDLYSEGLEVIHPINMPHIELVFEIA